MQTTLLHACNRRPAKVAGALIGLIALALPVTAQTILINGDFENATPAAWASNSWAKYFELSTNSTALSGWAYASGGGAPDVVASYYPQTSPLSGAGNIAQLGAGSNATGGSLSQLFATTTGATYTASLDVAYMGNGGGSAITFGIYDAGNGDALVASQTTSFDSLTSSFQRASFDFVAPSTNLLFRISDASGPTWDTDVAADNASVSLRAIPEPSTYAVIAGVLALSFAFWRRQRR